MLTLSSLSRCQDEDKDATPLPHAIAAVVTKKRYELVLDVVVVTRPPLSRSLSDATPHAIAKCHCHTPFPS